MQEQSWGGGGVSSLCKMSLSSYGSVQDGDHDGHDDDHDDDGDHGDQRS